MCTSNFKRGGRKCKHSAHFDHARAAWPAARSNFPGDFSHVGNYAKYCFQSVAQFEQIQEFTFQMKTLSRPNAMLRLAKQMQINFVCDILSAYFTLDFDCISQPRHSVLPRNSRWVMNSLAVVIWTPGFCVRQVSVCVCARSLLQNNYVPCQVVSGLMRGLRLDWIKYAVQCAVAERDRRPRVGESSRSLHNPFIFPIPGRLGLRFYL